VDRSPLIDGRSAALLTDLYELTMAQAYLAEGMGEPAVFSLFFRRLPRSRNFVLSCGLDDTLLLLETLAFSAGDIDYLRSLDQFSSRFLAALREFRFEGDVWAVPDGTPMFPGEPLLEVVAPIAQAQLVETVIMNQMHSQSVLATKASRVVEAAAGRPVIDFGIRRTHGIDAGAKAARAFHVGGAAGTSNVLGGKLYGIPVAGTMAHSYIQAHDGELSSFRAFAQEFPRTTLLVDTYDTLHGVHRVVELSRELGDGFAVRGVRLDSGDLASLAIDTRQILDAAGLSRLEIFASGGLDEYEVRDLVDRGAPIDGFGVGTSMGVSADAPCLDLAYKLAEYAGVGRVKLSPRKPMLPGRKQIFRQRDRDGRAVRDVVARASESLEGEPLLQCAMARGQIVNGLPPHRAAEVARARARAELERLPDRLRSIDPADPPYEVTVSDLLRADLAVATARAAEQ
jgi:nicotinate phosphoribosyltransferase